MNTATEFRPIGKQARRATQVTPTQAVVRPGLWTGLVVSDSSKHRGTHAAVLFNDGTPLCIVGPASDRQCAADARLLAHLWNEARKANVSIAVIN